MCDSRVAQLTAAQETTRSADRLFERAFAHAQRRGIGEEEFLRILSGTSTEFDYSAEDYVIGGVLV